MDAGRAKQKLLWSCLTFFFHPRLRTDSATISTGIGCRALSPFFESRLFLVCLHLKYVQFAGLSLPHTHTAGLHRAPGPLRRADRGQASRGARAFQHRGHARGDAADAQRRHCDHDPLQDRGCRLCGESRLLISREYTSTTWAVSRL